MTERAVTELTIEKKTVGQFLGGLVHDLRNPAATMRANVDFLRDVEPTDEDVPEALSDIDFAINELARGLERVDWIARWLCGQAVLKSEDGSVRQSLEEESIEASYPEGSTNAIGGRAVGAIARLFVDAAKIYGEVKVSVSRTDEDVVITIADTGPAVAAKFLDDFFTMEGQYKMKGASGGRYARYGAFVAAYAAADSIGAKLTVNRDRAEVNITLKAMA